MKTLIQRVVRFIESAVFVLLMALCCLGSLIVCFVLSLLVTMGREWRGRHWAGMGDLK